MAQRKIYTARTCLPGPGGTMFECAVYRDSEWDEYVCRLYVNAQLEQVSYFTDDRQDAIDTAERIAVEALIKAGG